MNLCVIREGDLCEVSAGMVHLLCEALIPIVCLPPALIKSLISPLITSGGKRERKEGGGKKKKKRLKGIWVPRFQGDSVKQGARRGGGGGRDGWMGRLWRRLIVLA